MSKQVPAGLTPVALLTLAAALGTLLTVGIPYVLDKEPIKSSDWLGFAGAFLGAMVALIAAAYAWRGVQVQIKALQDATTIALVGREEDRLEKELPSLRDTRLRFERWAVNYETAVKGQVPEVFVALLKEDGIGVAKNTHGFDRMTFEEIDKAFPNASLQLRNAIFEKLGEAWSNAQALASLIPSWKKENEAFSQQPDADPSKLPEHLSVLTEMLTISLARADENMVSLRSIVAGIDKRIAEIEARLPVFRKIIESGLK